MLAPLEGRQAGIIALIVVRDPQTGPERTGVAALPLFYRSQPGAGSRCKARDGCTCPRRLDVAKDGSASEAPARPLQRGGALRTCNHARRLPSASPLRQGASGGFTRPRRNPAAAAGRGSLLAQLDEIVDDDVTKRMADPVYDA